jgi:PKD repeat protein
MKNDLFKKLSFLLIAAITSSSFAQIDLGNVRPGETVEYCITHKKMHDLKQDPAFVQQFNIDQQSLQATLAYMNQNPQTNRVIYKIPVVFHILHNGGVENITNDQVQNAVDILNRDFRLLNSDANNVQTEFNASNPNAVAMPSDIEVEFVLATKAPNGTCFNGITRTQSSLSYSDNGSGQVNAIVNGNNVYNGEWAGNKYLNIFVCGEIGGAAGYTYTPSTWIGSAMDNGIWILHDYVGAIGTGGVGTSRALTHEVGHWLNLSHTWGPNNNPGNATSCSDDDQVSDTPNTIGVTSCSLQENTCGSKANVENYMDYSYCSKMFTGGQKSRMRAALNNNTGGRNNLWQAINLVSTGADGDTYLCAASFYSDKTKICPGDQIQFFDDSYNNVSGWTWSFPGATATSSTAQNPTVTYNTPGVYQVTLVATDGSTTRTKTIPTYITVLNAVSTLPFLDGFETYSNIATSNYWESINPQNNAKFEVTTSASHTGSKSVKLSNFGQSGSNTDELIANPVDLTGVTSTSEITLSFRFSYKKRNSTNSEKLYVSLSGNCGDTWEIRKTIQGNNLSGDIVTSAWTPSTEADWTTVHVTNIISQYWNNGFRYKFRFDGSGGNNIYLDDINIYESGPSEELVTSTSGVNSISEDKIELSIYPNPADQEFTVSYHVENAAPAKIQIMDMTGKLLSTTNINSNSGKNLVFIGTSSLSTGMYLVKIKIDGNEFVKQMTIK